MKIREFSVKPGEDVKRMLDPYTIDEYYLDSKEVRALRGLPATCGALTWEEADTKDPFGSGSSPFGYTLQPPSPMCDQGRHILHHHQRQPEQPGGTHRAWQQHRRDGRLQLPH